MLVSAALSANTSIADYAYDIPKISQYLDWISLKPYERDCNFNHTAGYTIHADPDNSNLKASINYWLKMGAAPEKLMLGMSSFGWVYELKNWLTHDYNVPYIGFVTAMKYNEICKKVKEPGWKIERDERNKIRPYAHNNKSLVFFDDVEDIRAKGKFICEMNLGGGVFWTLNFDDFKGSCGNGKFPLISALNQEIRGISAGGAQLIKFHASLQYCIILLLIQLY